MRSRSLQFDRGLAFVSDEVAQSRNRRDRIEQSPGTRAKWRVQSPLDHHRHGAEHVGFDAVGEHVRPHAGVEQVRECHPPRFADRLVAARKRNRPQVCDAAKPAVIADEKLTAPDRAVRAVTGSVECHADDRLVQPVLGHARRHVRMVVLHSHKPHSRFRDGPLQRVAGRGVIGVQVVRDDCGSKTKQPLVVGNCFGEAAKCFVVIKITVMMAQDRATGAAEGERRLQLPAGR